MKSIEQQHAEIVTGLKNNRTVMTWYLGRNVKLLVGNEEIKGQVGAVSGYDMTIKGIDGTLDPSLKGMTKYEYKDIKAIYLI